MKIGVRLLVASVLALVVGSAWAQSSPPVGAILTAAPRRAAASSCSATAPRTPTRRTPIPEPGRRREAAPAQRQGARRREDAVGDALKAAGVPIDKSISSRFARAVETARLIGGRIRSPRRT